MSLLTSSSLGKLPLMINLVIPYMEMNHVIKCRRINSTWLEAPNSLDCSHSMKCVIERDYGSDLDKNFGIMIGEGEKCESISQVCKRLNGTFEEVHENVLNAVYYGTFSKHYVFDTLLTHGNARILLQLINKVLFYTRQIIILDHLCN